jgi:hypothetical protein
MKIRLSLPLALACLSTVAFATDPLTDSVNAANHLQIGDAAAVNGVPISIGHMKINLISGSAARVLAGTEPVGIFFRGNGVFEYETTDTAEFPVVSHNVRAIAHLKMVADAAHTVLSDSFTDLVLVGSGITIPVLSGSGGGALAEPFKRHQDLFSRLRIEPWSHILTVQKFSFPLATRVRAEFSGGHDTLLYEYDDAEDRNESLYAVRPLPMYIGDRRLEDRLYPQGLSSQPVGHPRGTTPRPPFALTAIDYTLVGNGDEAELAVTETLWRAAETQHVLRFDMLGERFVRAGAPIRAFHVRSVTDEQGRPLPFDHDHNDLLVSVDGVSGQTLRLKFSVDGDFLVREGGDNAWQLGIGDAWLPLPRQWAGQAFTVHSVVRVKKPFVPYAPGTTVSRREEGDYNIVENVIDKPVEGTTVQAGKYNTYEEKRGPRTLRVATYALRNDRAAKQLIGLADAVIDYYEYFLGPFPFNEFNIIQMNEYGYGQAPPGTMYITNEAFQPLLTETDRFFSQGINERFAHEIAHQYWGHVVRMPSPEEQWLTESFAEYSAALALRKLKGEGAYNRLVSVWRGRARDGLSVAPIPYANRIVGDPTTAFAQRFALLYAKGPYLLYTLHRELGDTTFLTFMKSYTKSFSFKFGTTNDVAGLLQFMTKKDYRPFFEKYFWGTAMPD